ncbi:MAG: nickel-dependent lactate racemase [Promethearchaeota archaeon]
MTQIVKVPWAAWRDPKYLELNFPDSWDITEFKMNGWDRPELSDEQIKQGIINPIGTPRLNELAKGKENVVIVVDDMTRTTPVSKILPDVLSELNTAGVNDDNITILLAIGAHKPMNREDRILKLGEEIVEKYNIENHHPYENLTNLGESSNGTPIEVNTTYYNADLKISLGGVIPHPLAGFGGGAKIVLPGISGINTLEANHSAAQTGRLTAGIGIVTGIRKDIEEIASKVGLDFSINVIFNEYGRIAALNSGHFKKAHRKAMELAKEIYSTKITLGNDICFFNSYPEDTELNQAVKAFNFLMIAPKKMITRMGGIVIMSSSYEGRGYHSLIAETGARLYSNIGESGLFRAFVKKRKVYFFSPNISKSDLYHHFPESVELYKNWNALIDTLIGNYADPIKVGILPTSIQLVA